MNFRFNGFGVWVLGQEATEKENEWLGTQWITALFFPIIPLRRLRVEIVPGQTKRQPPRFMVKETVPLSWPSILKTYLFGFIVMPAIIFWPVPFAVVEVQQALGIPEGLQTPLIIFSICWMIGAMWKLKDWEEDRWKTFHKRP